MKRLLMVDDEPDRVGEWRQALERYFHVTTATTVEAARRLVREQRFEVLVTDLNLMPARGGDGTRAGLEVIEAFGGPQSRPVILFTNARDSELFGRLTVSGITVLRKRDYDPEALALLVAQLAGLDDSPLIAA